MLEVLLMPLDLYCLWNPEPHAPPICKIFNGILEIIDMPGCYLARALCGGGHWECDPGSLEAFPSKDTCEVLLQGQSLEIVMSTVSSLVRSVHGPSDEQARSIAASVATIARTQCDSKQSEKHVLTGSNEIASQLRSDICSSLKTVEKTAAISLACHRKPLPNCQSVAGEAWQALQANCKTINSTSAVIV
jgi:hypothetical protein